MKTTSRFPGSVLLAAFLLTWATVQSSIASTPRDVLNHYLSVRSALAQDSMKSVTSSARALAEAVRGDSTKSLPPAIASQADVLATAKTLAKARKAFKPLSESLIAYFKDKGVPSGTYWEVYCPVAKASWLQAGEMLKNPYLGPRSMTPAWGWACVGIVRAKLERRDADKGDQPPTVRNAEAIL